jgi:hypothetical protein
VTSDKNLLLGILYKRIQASQAAEKSLVRSDVTIKKIIRCMRKYYDKKID